MTPYNEPPKAERERYIKEPPIVQASQPPGCAEDITSSSFNFSELPGEIRNEIYRLCLVNKDPIPVWDVNFTLSGRDKQAKRTKLQETKQHSVTGNFPTNLGFNLGLLRVSKFVYAEAVAILYGLNTFQFKGRNCWRNLISFDFNMTDFGHQHVRKVAIEFPHVVLHIDEIRISRTQINLPETATNGLKILKSFPNLVLVTYYITEDILPIHSSLLRQARFGFKRTCQFLVDVPPFLVYSARGHVRYRAIRIAAVHFRTMNVSKIRLQGTWEKVDKHHRLWNQGDWLREILEEQRVRERFERLITSS
ncbi:MAG: hypothetical protein Q9178_004539 [Gyalolechia marmorata]